MPPRIESYDPDSADVDLTRLIQPSGIRQSRRWPWWLVGVVVTAAGRIVGTAHLWGPLID